MVYLVKCPLKGTNGFSSPNSARDIPGKHLGAVLLIVIVAPILAMASPYESYTGILPNNRAVSGARGSLMVVTPYVSPTGFGNHKDFMVYVLKTDAFNGNRAIGAGWYADGSGSTGNYNLVYWYEPGTPGPSHTLWTSVSSGAQFTAQVKQNSQGSNCWTGTTYNGNSASNCFTLSFGAGGVASYIGRGFTEYQAGVNDMPSLADQLHYYYWNNGVNTYDSTSYFSYNTNLSKCWSNKAAYGTNSYVVDQLAKESSDPNGQPIDKIGTGPRLYTSDNCPSGNIARAWEVAGETTKAGGG